MALDIADTAYFEAVVAFAEREGRLDDLGAKLRWLDTFGSGAPTKCVMSPAPQPYAFDLVMFQRGDAAWRPVFAGRLAYQTPDARDGSGAGPSFTVSITSTPEPAAPPPTVAP